MHGQRGQATIDYVALLAVLALLLGAAAAIAAGGAPGVTNAVVGQLRHALCIVSGRACAAERRLPCVVASRRDAHHVAVTIVVVRLDGDRYVLREDLSDDTVRLTIAHRGGAGGEVASGSRAQIDVGGRTIGGEREAHTGGQAVLGHGEVFIARDGREADAILRELRGSGPLGIGRGGPDPEETFVEGGIRALSRVGVAGSRAGAALESLSNTIVAARRNRVTGEVTISLGAGAASWGLLHVLMGGPSGSLDRQVGLELKFDRDGRAIELSLTAAGTIAAGGMLPAIISAALRRGGAAGIAVAGGELGGRRWELGARLDLTAPAVAAAWSAVRRNRANAAAIRALGAILAAQSHLDARSYAVSSEFEGAAASVAHVLKVGGEFDHVTDTARLLSASTRPPGGAWERRADCLAARTGVPA